MILNFLQDEVFFKRPIIDTSKKNAWSFKYYHFSGRLLYSST